MKKAFLAVLSVFIILLAGMPAMANPAGAFSYQFADIEGHPWGAADMKKMVQLGILQGYAGGDKFYAQPEKLISRAEFAAMLARTLNLADGKDTPPFTDWHSVPGWARGPVSALYAAEIVRGNPNPDGTVSFLPWDNISRAEIVAMLTRALETDPGLPPANPFRDVREGDWFYKAVLAGNKMGIVYGRTADSFAPEGTATRVEVMAMLSRFLDKDAGNQPSDSSVTSVVYEFSDRIVAALNGGSKDGLEGYLTGEAELALKSGGLGLWESVPAGGKVEVSHPEGAPQVEFKSNRLARVKYVTQAAITGAGENLSKVTITVTEYYYLQKIEGIWKIYSVEVELSSAGTGM